MSAIRTSRRASVAWPRCVMVLALTIFSAALASAQNDAASDSRAVMKSEAAAAARRQLEEALASDDGNRRFPALRVARFMDDPWIAELALPLCQAPDLVERVLALEVVANTDPAVGKQVFLDVLTSGERALRLRGLLGLIALRDPDTVPDLVEIMRHDPDPDLQVTAARALGSIGDIKASVALYGAIDNDYAPLREQAVLSLIAIGDDGIGNFLISKLVNGHFPGQAEVLRLMSLMDDPVMVEAIEPFLHHEDHVRRTLAAGAILSILERSGNLQP
ncbi:MAG: HEAT repeat domain-containing protein [Thermoanaerobaculales bacterium]|nr:HEAT repeat domain-containing protein [Thermoanaerobaculales bacterium]